MAMKQIQIETLEREEATLTGAGARRVNGAGPIVCTAAGCFPVPPYAAVAYPTLPLAYPTYPTYLNGIAPLYGPLVAGPTFPAPIVPVFIPRRRRHRW
jgi:hypothetical protein